MKGQKGSEVVDLIARLQEQISSLDKKLDVLMGRMMATPALMVKPQKHQEKIMHKITCADCGKEDSLPFKPAEGRPVYCKECFSLRRRGGGPTRAEDGYSNIAPTLSPVKQASKAPEAKPKKKPAAPAKKAAPKKKTTAKKK